MNKRLYDCATAVERLEWVKSRLTGGHVVVESTLLTGGVLNPHALIAGLRASGMEIETVRTDLVDAKGAMHTGCTAWRLLPSAMGREQARAHRQATNTTNKHHTSHEHGKAA